MEAIEKKVFISYRRSDVAWAFTIYRDLSKQGYDVFIDLGGVASGDFAPVVLGNIRARSHFVLLLTPTALDRCDEPGDWLRQEIETALDTRRNIVPIFLERFDYKTPAIANRLTRALKLLTRYQGIQLQPEYFEEAMERLRERLNVAVTAVAHPPSQEMMISAEIAQRARLTEEFVSMLSHELRTPLTVILTWADLLRREPFEAEKMQQGLDKIILNAEALSRLIENMLEHARATLNRLQLQRENVVIARPLEQAIDSMLSLMNQRRIELVRDLAAAQHAIVAADPSRLRLVFSNLLSNAVKFTPERGRIDIITKSTSDEIAVVIRDNGQGFTRESAPLFFAGFGRDARSVDGLEFSLRVAQEIVDLHGGAIKAESEGPGQGATLTVTLPLAKE